MNSETALEHIKMLRKNLNGAAPELFQALDKAIEVLVIDASKQKMKNELKEIEAK